MNINIGDAFKDPGIGKIHVRGFVDEHIVVYRYWRRRKQYWQYMTIPDWVVTMYVDAGFWKPYK